MDRPPSAPNLRKVESCTSSLSSIDIPTNPYYDAQSRRLVDYFVVFTSKPHLKNKKKSNSEESNTEDDGNKDHSENGKMKTPPRNFCCKKKPKTKKGRRTKSSTSRSPKYSNDETEVGSSRSSKRERRQKKNSSHEIHLVNNLLDDDETQIFSNRKKLSSRKTIDSESLMFSGDEQNDFFPGIPSSVDGEELRLPVTRGSGSIASSSDADSDIETDDEFATKKTKQLASHSKTKDKVEAKIEEEEPLTPSRMRAKQGIDDDDDDDDSGKHRNDRNSLPQEDIDQKISSPSTPNKERDRKGGNVDRGATENIHVPGSDVKSIDESNNLYLVPVQTARYPPQDHPDNPFNPMLKHFCFPQGQQIQLLTEYIMPRIHYFVLTNDRGKKMYGTCLTVYEEFDVSANPDIDEIDLRPFYRNDDVCVETSDSSESSIEVSLDYVEKCPPLYHPKVICILSSWPYLHAFREYLSQLYRKATMTNTMQCPIERFVLNICEEVPAPPPGMFEIRLQVSFK